MNEQSNMGERIKAYRTQCGFNQQSIARFLGVDQTLISKVENGERTLSVELLEKLAALFGVEVTAFERADVPVSTMKFAFRASDLSNSDMEALCAINKIALNSQMLAKILDRRDRRG